MNAVRISPVGRFVRNDMLASMGSLFAELARQASTNARREVETYTREIPEFGFLDKDPEPGSRRWNTRCGYGIERSNCRRTTAS